VDAILICCEFGSKKSFEDIKNFWWAEVCKHADSDSEKFIIVNKVDLQNKELDLTDVKRFCDTNN
jgi:GTPase SAR1 family protein